MVADVYHGLEGVARGAVKYLRVLEQVPRPWAAQCKGNRDESDQQHIVITKDTHLGLKVQPQIDGEKVRVFSPKKDDLQAVIVSLRKTDFPLALSFVNYR